jgi:hypothetical protein
MKEVGGAPGVWGAHGAPADVVGADPAQVERRMGSPAAAQGQLPEAGVVVREGVHLLSTRGNSDTGPRRHSLGQPNTPSAPTNPGETAVVHQVRLMERGGVQEETCVRPSSMVSGTRQRAPGGVKSHDPGLNLFAADPSAARGRMARLGSWDVDGEDVDGDGLASPLPEPEHLPNPSRSNSPPLRLQHDAASHQSFEAAIVEEDTSNDAYHHSTMTAVADPTASERQAEDEKSHFIKDRNGTEATAESPGARRPTAPVTDDSNSAGALDASNRAGGGVGGEEERAAAGGGAEGEGLGEAPADSEANAEAAVAAATTSTAAAAAAARGGVAVQVEGKRGMEEGAEGAEVGQGEGIHLASRGGQQMLRALGTGLSPSAKFLSATKFVDADAQLSVDQVDPSFLCCWH